MSYLVLARKWRPRNFSQVVGQNHVLQALTNSFTQQKVHHAYLFSGTRGVGKTTLARIIAKCINCETGITATPCEKCSACQQIDQGRFIDLFEIDAASRTRVEETRELLDNVPYKPTQGRYKVYLIDEVHMLSGHSFNALLKTLEEPPAHVIFILATTDPQRLPKTVLSRCLQFHLKPLSVELITGHLAELLTQEKIDFEQTALLHLAKAATGSMRDALSLLDQAIAFGNQQIKTADVLEMLGSAEPEHLFALIEALAENNASQLLSLSDNFAAQNIDLLNLLDELLVLLHDIALQKSIPDYANPSYFDNSKIKQFAEQFSKEDLQLYYQIALHGRKDLPLAPNARVGFSMTLLRLLAFRPATPQAVTQATTQAAPPQITPPAATQKVASKPLATPTPVIKSNTAAGQWDEICIQLKVSGLCQALASHCILLKKDNNQITLLLEESQTVLLNDSVKKELATALSEHFKSEIELTVQTSTEKLASPQAVAQDKQQQQLDKATQSIENDPNVKEILQQFDGKIIPESISSQETSE